MKILLDNNEFELMEDYKNGFNELEVKEKYTDYFNDFDYVVGDYSYGKLRLKGFCDKNNKRYSKINDIKEKDKYIKDLCAYECKYFVLKKVKKG